MQNLPSNTHFTHFLSPPNPNYSPKFHFLIPLKLLQSHTFSPLSASNESSTSPILTNYANSFDDDVQIGQVSEQVDFFTKSLLVRRPVMEDDYDVEQEEETGVSFLSVVDLEISKLAKKMPVSELKSDDFSAAVERLPTVSVDAVLSNAKVLMKSLRFREAERILQECIHDWPKDGRAYVLLGKILLKQARDDEARAVYEKGCLATHGKNAFIWQRWAVLESKKGNLRRARELFRVATVCVKEDSVGWDCWAVMELKEGNYKRARNILTKALKFCGGGEYIYHTLARIEAKAKRFDQSRDFFRQATNCNPNSSASWDGWAKMEAQQGNNHIARRLFKKAIQARPKDAFAWHSWGFFEASLGNVDQGRKLLKIGYALNPSDPVILQSLGLLEYKYSTPTAARIIFKKASELDSSHQPVWFAWGWMEWKEGNLAKARDLYQRTFSINSTNECAAICLKEWGQMEWEVGNIDKARELYQRALSIGSTNETAAHVFHGWAVLEQRAGNPIAARRLFRASLNIKSHIETLMAWASLEEDQGNLILAKEIRDLGFQQEQGTEVSIDDASSSRAMEDDLDISDPASDSMKKLVNGFPYSHDSPASTADSNIEEDDKDLGSDTEFDLDAFIFTKLNLNPSELDKKGVFAAPRKRVNSRWVRPRLREKAASSSVEKVSHVVQVLRGRLVRWKKSEGMELSMELNSSRNWNEKKLVNPLRLVGTEWNGIVIQFLGKSCLV